MMRKQPERQCFQCNETKRLPSFKLRGYAVVTYTDGKSHRFEGWVCDDCVQAIKPLLEENGGATHVS